MRKKDVSFETLSPWDEFRNKHLDEALPAIYSEAESISRENRFWYWRSIRSKRISSLTVRGVTFSLLIIGTLLPILAGLNNDTQLRLTFTQIGVSVLAFAGLCLVADRVFGWSSGWLRYVTTVTAMENRTHRFERDWESYIVDKGANIADGDIRGLFDIANQFEEDITKLRTDETEKWVAEFNSGLALLGELVKSQRESSEKALELQQKAVQERESSQKTGSIQLDLVQKGTPSPVSIAFDDEPGQEFLGGAWARKDVTAGQHILTITTIGKIHRAMKKVVNVEAGGIAQAAINIA